MRTLSIPEARRIALAAQGFCDRRPKGLATERQFRRVLERMAILQLDSVNVLCRSHFLPVFARLGAYDRDRLDDWLWRSGENHEFVAHEASITRMDLYPLLRHRMTIERWKSGTRFAVEEADYLAAVRNEIHDRGPLSIKELSDPGERSGSFWGWSKGKLALEVMHRSGTLAVAERNRAFVTRYDLTERVVPETFRNQPPLTAEQAQRRMLSLAAQSHGVATEHDLADYFRLKVPACRPLLQAMVDDGELTRVNVEGWDAPTYLAPKAKRPRSVTARALLSPFDPLVWFRPRAARLFNFEYRIEIYVPEAKRCFGYYVLPFLLGDKIVGRVDLKADRQAGVLRAKAAYLEDGENADTVATALAETLVEVSKWLALDAVTVGRKGNLARALAAALR